MKSNSNRVSPNKTAPLNGWANTSGQDFHKTVSVNGKMPVKYIADYPAFLKPNKHHPYRRLNDSHVETVMQSALERYEKGLQDKKKEKETDA